MKLAILICATVLLAAFVAADEPREPNCEQYADSVCSRVFEPVCGDDGNTYPTECVLCSENTIRQQLVKVAYEGGCEIAPV